MFDRKKQTNKICLSINQKLKTDYYKQVKSSVSAMWVSALYIIVDGIFVSKGVGVNALAAVNLTVPFINIIFGLSVLLSVGASTVTSCALGSGNDKKANEYFSISLIVLTILSATLSICSYLNLENLSIFLGADNQNIEIVQKYLGTIILFSPFYIISYALEVLVKVDGYPHLSLIGVIISGITNIILDYIFVILFKWGVQGAALATGIARLSSFIFFIYHFTGKKSKLKFVKCKLKLKTIKRIISIGFPDCITELSVGIIILLFNKYIFTMIGNTGLIAYSVISYINTLVVSTMLGVSQGLQPLTSFYNGLKDAQSIKQVTEFAFKTVTMFSLAILFICLFFTDTLVSIFIDKSNVEVFEYSVKVLKVFSLSFSILGFNILTSGLLSSLEKVKEASTISIGRGLVLPFIVIIFATYTFGKNAIWISTIISELIVLIISCSKIRKLFKAY